MTKANKAATKLPTKVRRSIFIEPSDIEAARVVRDKALRERLGLPGKLNPKEATLGNVYTMAIKLGLPFVLDELEEL